MIHLFGGPDPNGSYEGRCAGVWRHKSLCGKIVERGETTNESAIERVGCRQCLRLRLFKRRGELVKLADRIARLEKLIADLR